jgi:3-dehydroquinate synthase
MKSLFRDKEVSLSSQLKEDLRELSASYAADKVFMVFESNTWTHCWPLIRDFREIPDNQILVLMEGEDQKNIQQVMEVWSRFGERGIDRKSLIINVGGGMLTDLGGFAASTLKRGVAFINVPTTLLAMVDASVGGKSGINFRGFKNEIGVIRQPLHVVLFLPFLHTLDQDNLLSGYAEMLKAGLIADAGLWKHLKDYNIGSFEEQELSGLIWRSVQIKKIVVEADPEEGGIRKSLNFGHTIGHAFESESLHSGHPYHHGFAVAWGMMAEAWLSVKKLGFPQDDYQEIRETIIRLYGMPPAGFRNPEVLIPWMRFDKKNSGNQINFTLLERIGKCKVNCTATEEEITETLLNF